MNKKTSAALMVAVLGLGIGLGKGVGRVPELWATPAAPDTGEGWAPPVGTPSIEDSGAKIEAAVKEVDAAVAGSNAQAVSSKDPIAEAQSYYQLIVKGPPETITEDSFKCNNPYRVYAMIIFAVAAADPMATEYPVPVGAKSEGNYYIGIPDMGSATTEFVQGASTFCSVKTRVGVLNQNTHTWGEYPPVTDQEVHYEIVRTDDGKVRVHYLTDNGTRFN